MTMRYVDVPLNDLQREFQLYSSEQSHSFRRADCMLKFEPVSEIRTAG